MCDEQWTQRERTTFFLWVGGEEKKMSTDYFLCEKKIPLTFFFFHGDMIQVNFLGMLYNEIYINIGGI
jgi:hypothetical protein